MVRLCGCLVQRRRSHQAELQRQLRGTDGGASGLRDGHVAAPDMLPTSTEDRFGHEADLSRSSVSRLQTDFYKATLRDRARTRYGRSAIRGVDDAPLMRATSITCKVSNLNVVNR